MSRPSKFDFERRAKAVGDSATLESALTALQGLGDTVDRPTLRQWCRRHRIYPQGGLTAKATTIDRLEAAEGFSDTVGNILTDLPARLTGPRAAKALGQIEAAYEAYLAQVGTLRGLA